ncbi:hypothetical protein ETB97_012365 [Aspergillus alliaceus]|uniref:Uncharacterized protein n=1 Tax=Petromyces alliaceus TaxID=209559 RepID=A0A8H6A6E5_PETAA|nr:hypothetical protein ETB97_012365 [Aspergillus burnettii]
MSSNLIDDIANEQCASPHGLPRPQTQGASIEDISDTPRRSQDDWKLPLEGNYHARGFHTALGLPDPVLWFTSSADANSGHIRGWHNLCRAVRRESSNSVFTGHKGL